MKNTRIDKLGRIVIPKSYREALSITEHTDLIITFSNKDIIITPSENLCKVCGKETAQNLKFPLCAECVKKIKTLDTE